MKRYKYSDLRQTLKTGDLILFASDAPVSRFMTLILRNPWTHVGMVIKLEAYDFVCMWESTCFSTTRDVESGKYVQGVQVASLRDRVTRHRGDVGVRFLQGVTINGHDMDKLLNLKRQIGDRPFENDVTEFIAPLLWGQANENLNALFNAELIAEAYQALNVFDSNVASNSFLPSDFTGNNLPFVEGYLSEIHQVIPDV